MTLSTVQELPNRVNTALGNATRGSSTGTDTNDPLFLDHNGSHYVYCPGTATNRLSVPDEAALDITGDIDIRVKVAANDYTPSAASTLIAKRGASGQVSWQLRIETSGVLTLAWSEDGTAIQTAASTVATGLTDQATKWIQVTADVDNGASDSDFKFYTSDDGASWTQLGATVNSGAATSIFASTATVEIGAYNTTTSPWAGIVHRAQIYDGIAGTLVLDINPATDIDTSADADAGQATFTCTTGQTVTVNRSTSGLTTTVVTRPVMCFDGTDDYLQLPASDTPTFTKTTGKYTAVVAFREHNVTGTRRLFSSESAANDGAYLYAFGASLRTAAGDGSVVTATAGNYTATDLSVGALVADTGSLYAYLNGAGLSGATALSGITADPTHGTPRIASRGDSPTNFYYGEVFSVLIFEDVALTEAQLDTLSTKLINGDYS